jgi:RHS repeat-associated protein
VTQALTLYRTSWNLGKERSCDVWGGVRSGNATGGPKGRTCANLGHVQDDESGLIYMRARYYEPSTGRFISEDPAADGTNWYNYCSNLPTIVIDPTGLMASVLAGSLEGVEFELEEGLAAAAKANRGLMLLVRAMTQYVTKTAFYAGDILMVPGKATAIAGLGNVTMKIANSNNPGAFCIKLTVENGGNTRFYALISGFAGQVNNIDVKKIDTRFAYWILQLMEGG